MYIYVYIYIYTHKHRAPKRRSHITVPSGRSLQERRASLGGRPQPSAPCRRAPRACMYVFFFILLFIISLFVFFYFIFISFFYFLFFSLFYFIFMFSLFLFCFIFFILFYCLLFLCFFVYYFFIISLLLFLVSFIISLLFLCFLIKNPHEKTLRGSAQQVPGRSRNRSESAESNRIELLDLKTGARTGIQQDRSKRNFSGEIGLRSLGFRV